MTIEQKHTLQWELRENIIDWATYHFALLSEYPDKNIWHYTGKEQV